MRAMTLTKHLWRAKTTASKHGSSHCSFLWIFWIDRQWLHPLIPVNSWEGHTIDSVTRDLITFWTIRDICRRNYTNDWQWGWQWPRFKYIPLVVQDVRPLSSCIKPHHSFPAVTASNTAVGLIHEELSPSTGLIHNTFKSLLKQHHYQKQTNKGHYLTIWRHRFNDKV